LTGIQIFGALMSLVMTVVATVAVLSGQISLTTMAPIERGKRPILYWGYIGLFALMIIGGIFVALLGPWFQGLQAGLVPRG
jgi:hypothetical protein